MAAAGFGEIINWLKARYLGEHLSPFASVDGSPVALVWFKEFADAVLAAKEDMVDTLEMLHSLKLIENSPFNLPDGTGRVLIIRESVLRYRPDKPGAADDLPEWSSARRVLKFRGEVIRDFAKRKAPRQEGILDAFEAAGWERETIEANHDGPTLKQTVDALNEKVKENTIRFSRAGDGKTVRWVRVNR